MKRIFLGLVLLGLSSVGALAACGGTTAQVTDAAAATRQMALVNDPTGTNCAGVTASDIKYLNGTALASPAAYGTAPTGNVIGVNAFVTNTLAAGQAVMASSSPVVIASNQSAIPVTLTSTTITGTAAVTQSGTWTVQPGNTANTTPWLVTGPATGLPSTPGTLAGGATFVSGTTAAMTVTTSTQVIAAVASNRIYVTRVKCNNSSGTATLVQIRDGAAGTVLDTLAAGATYGGEQGTGPTPLFWTTAGTALFAQNVTTGASVICTASGYSG